MLYSIIAYANNRERLNSPWALIIGLQNAFRRVYHDLTYSTYNLNQIRECRQQTQIVVASLDDSGDHRSSWAQMSLLDYVQNSALPHSQIDACFNKFRFLTSYGAVAQLYLKKCW